MKKYNTVIPEVQERADLAYFAEISMDNAPSNSESDQWMNASKWSKFGAEEQYIENCENAYGS